jgi:uncharacterized membrane protein
MSLESKDAIRAAVRAAQERYEADTQTTREARRKAFAKAREEGLSLREISEEVVPSVRASARRADLSSNGSVIFQALHFRRRGSAFDPRREAVLCQLKSAMTGSASG